MLKEEYLVYENENNESIHFGYFYDLIPIQFDENIDNNLSVSKYAVQDGATFISSALSERTISIKAVYSVSKAKSIEAKIKKTFNPMIKGTFYKYSHNDYKKIEVHLESTPIITHEKGLGVVVINMVAFSPFYEVDKKVDVLSAEMPMLRFPINFVENKIFGTKIIEHETIIMNKGDVDVGFVCIFKANGEVRFPYIINNITNEQIYINDIMEANDVIEVVNLPYEKSVYKNGYKDLSLLDIAYSDFFKLKVGKNRIGVGAYENVSNLETRIEYIPLYL